MKQLFEKCLSLINELVQLRTLQISLLRSLKREKEISPLQFKIKNYGIWIGVLNKYIKNNVEIKNNDDIIKLKITSKKLEAYLIELLDTGNIKYVDDNNILQIVKNNIFTKVLDDTYVDKFFEINVDKSIENSVACKHILKSTKNQDQIFNDINICDNTQTKYSTNKLYDIIIDNALGKNC